MGARDFDFDIENGVAAFRPRAGQPIDPEAIRRAVEDGGSELLWLELEVRGTLHRARDPDGSERTEIAVAQTGQRFVLRRGESEAERTAFEGLGEWLEHPARELVVRGRVRSDPGAPLALVVGGVRPTE